MSNQEASCKFKPDFDRNDPDRPITTIQVNVAGARIHHVIPKSNGKSMEQLLDETFPRLEEYYQLLPAQPPAPEKFRLMQASLIEEADEAYRRLVALVIIVLSQIRLILTTFNQNWSSLQSYLTPCFQAIVKQTTF